jgi:ribonuclease HI
MQAKQGKTTKRANDDVASVCVSGHKKKYENQRVDDAASSLLKTKDSEKLVTPGSCQ